MGSLPRPPKTSVRCAPENKDTDMPNRVSTESFPVSCAKEVTSPTTMEPVESQSMAPVSMMRTLTCLMLEEVSFRWPTQAPTLTDRSSSSALPIPHGWMESTLFLEVLLMDLMLSTRLKPSVPNLEPLPRLLRSRQVERSPSNQISKIILSGGLVSAFPNTTVRNFRRSVDHHTENAFNLEHLLCFP